MIVSTYALVLWSLWVFLLFYCVSLWCRTGEINRFCLNASCKYLGIVINSRNISVCEVAKILLRVSLTSRQFVVMVETRWRLYIWYKVIACQCYCTVESRENNTDKSTGECLGLWKLTKIWIKVKRVRKFISDLFSKRSTGNAVFTYW